MCQEETRESTKSSPGVKGLGERVIAQRQVDRTLKVFPRPSSSKKALLTWLLPLLHTWSYLFRDYLPLRLVSSVRAGMGSIGLAIDKWVPKVGSDSVYMCVCVVCLWMGAKAVHVPSTFTYSCLVSCLGKHGSLPPSLPLSSVQHFVQRDHLLYTWWQFVDFKRSYNKAVIIIPKSVYYYLILTAFAWVKINCSFLPHYTF